MTIRPSRILGPLLILLLFAAAVYLLSTQLTADKVRGIARRFAAMIRTSPGTIVLAVGLTALNYLILVGYDLLAVRYAGVSLSLRRIALASFTAYTCGYNFGSTLAGTSVRYRLYSAWGVPALKIVELLIILALTFWFGMLFLGGIVFIVAPLELPEALCATLARLHLHFSNTRPLGVIFLAIALAYVASSALHYASVKLWRWRLPVPPFKLTVCQILIASADLLLVAAVLYVLWPARVPMSYWQVLGIYMLVFVTGVLTHVPGGYAVMETMLIWIISQILVISGSQQKDVLAAWLLFRVIYYIAPLCCSLVLLGCYEMVLHYRARKELAAQAAEGRAAGSDGPPTHARPSNSVDS
jgi:uncharacterized membrane protein YbhN (UPF0104 family)